MVLKERFLSATVLCLLSGCALASVDCNQERERLIDNVSSLCATYESIVYGEDYFEVIGGIKEDRADYYMCEKNKSSSGAGLVGNGLFVKSKYALSQIDFYLKLREERKEHPEMWAVEKLVISKAVANDCNQFASEIKIGT